MDRTERQKEGVRKWQQFGCRATWCYCTGFGKTRTALMALKSFLVPFPNSRVKIIVPTEYLKGQWIQELIKYKLFNYCNVEIINTAITIEEKVDLLILDEVHRYAADKFYTIFKQCKPTYVLGLSATFDRLDGKHELLTKYCPVCDTVTVKEAVENKWLSPYKEYKVFIDVPDINEYFEHNRRFLDSFAFFGFDFDLALKCLTNIITRRKYAKDIGCSEGEVTAQVFTWNNALKARKSFIMNHPKKIEIARLILRHRVDKKAITFSATIAQAEKIGIGYTVHSGKTKKKNRITMEEFANIDTGVCNTAKSLDEGADVPGLNLGIILCNTSSDRQKTQRLGRIIRYQEGKEAELFTLVLRGTVENSWFNTSSSGTEYIEINEHELLFILNGGKSENIEKTAHADGHLFRL